MVSPKASAIEHICTAYDLICEDADRGKLWEYVLAMHNDNVSDDTQLREILSRLFQLVNPSHGCH